MSADLFASLFEGTEEEILNQDQGFTSNKIEKSGVYKFKITMAKELPGSMNSDAPRHFEVTLETEQGAVVRDKIEWYKAADGGFMSSKGELLLGAGKVARLNALITGIQNVPAITPMNVKEYDWKTKQELTVQRGVAAGLVGKFVQAKVIVFEVNKQVKGTRQKVYDYGENKGQLVTNAQGEPVMEYVDGPETRLDISVQRYFDMTTGQTVGEKQLNKPAENIIKDTEYCEKNQVINKVNPASPDIAVAGKAPIQTQQAPTQGSGFGSSGFGS